MAGWGAADVSAVEKVHIVWMNHLDVGFTNNIASVLNIYWHEYFPKAAATAKAVNKPGRPPVFKYTTHAWLLDLFFDCPRQLGLNCTADPEDLGTGTTPDDHPACVLCPDASLVALVEKAIADDVITWHAFPFNAEPELADSTLLRAGIDSVRRLDKRFGKANKTVISQRDVPGVTRGIVPIMAEQGVLAFSEGCNAQIQPPQTPGPLFNWSDTASGTSVFMLLHPRGYGLEEQDDETGLPLLRAGVGDPCPSSRDVVAVPGFSEALLYAFKDDNQGPPSPLEVAAFLACVREHTLFPPAAQLAGSTFDAFIAALAAHPTAARSLPVVTAEIGDTWIYGAQSDPKKMKLLRMMMRALSRCRGCDRPPHTEPAVANFSRLLLKPTEHTFGLHGLGGGAARAVWPNAALDAGAFTCNS